MVTRKAPEREPKPSDAEKSTDVGTKETQKPPKKTAKSEADASKPSRHSSFDDKMSLKLPRGYKEPSIEIDSIGKEWMVNVCNPARFRQPGTDEKYTQVGPFLCAFFMKRLHGANRFLSKQFVLYLCNMM